MMNMGMAAVLPEFKQPPPTDLLTCPISCTMIYGYERNE
jgi:hypothetical protein